jgi:3-dehydroquinate dehydratase/shikimate dehydrogenase
MSLCLSLRGDDPELLASRLAEVAGKVDRVEIRLDGAPDPFPWEIMESWDGECIAACQQGADRSSRLAAAVKAGAAWVDLPHDLARVPDLPDTTRAVWSWHETPSQGADLMAILASLEEKARPGDVCKVVAWAETPEEASRVYPLFEAARFPLVAFAQGPDGPASRVWAPSLGAPWTYVCWPAEQTAPGQWDWREAQAWPAPHSALFGVVGSSVAHSRSPLLWNEAYRRVGGGGPYAAVSAPDFRAFLDGHSHPSFRGFSVTAPFKKEALAAAGSSDDASIEAGASNFILRQEDGSWSAHQTDGPGALDSLEDAGLAEGCVVLILGAGGAARGAGLEALKRGHAVVFAARRKEAADEAAAGLAAQGSVSGIGMTGFDLEEMGAVIHATPVGSFAHPGNLLEDHTFAEGVPVLDMVYEPAWTGLLQQAAEQGAIPIPGRKMLVRQMVLQFALATGTALAAGPLHGLAAAHISGHSIALIGPRASGKTTLGRRLAEALGWAFLDADEELESSHGRSIDAWIPEDEDGFRHAEAEWTASLLASHPRQTVCALGGGAVENPPTRALLARFPRVLALVAPLEILLDRAAAGTRPPLTDLAPDEEIRHLLERRQPLDEEASRGHRVDVGGPPDQAWDALLTALDWDPC